MHRVCSVSHALEQIEFSTIVSGTRRTPTTSLQSTEIKEIQSKRIVPGHRWKGKFHCRLVAPIFESLNLPRSKNVEIKEKKGRPIRGNSWSLEENESKRTEFGGDRKKIPSRSSTQRKIEFNLGEFPRPTISSTSSVAPTLPYNIRRYYHFYLRHRCSWDKPGSRGDRSFLSQSKFMGSLRIPKPRTKRHGPGQPKNSRTPRHKTESLQNA